MKQFKNADEVIRALKQACDMAKKDVSRARETLRTYGISAGGYRDLKYRTFAGPFKVKDCEFSTDRFLFDPISLQASSYGWWCMLIIRNGKLIRNRCGYSMQTEKHQRMLDKALGALSIKADITVSTTANIGNTEIWIASTLEQWSEACIQYKYARKNRAGHRRHIARLEREMRKLAAAEIGMQFTDKAKTAALAKAESMRKSKNAWLKIKRKRRLCEPVRLEVNAPVIAHATPVAKAHFTLIKGV